MVVSAGKISEMMRTLRSAKIDTWFDLGLFIDRFKAHRKVPAAERVASFEGFQRRLATGGVTVISVAADDFPERSVAAFQRALPGVLVDVIEPFHRWPLYNDFFKTKLARGSPEYNALIGQFWGDALTITQRLARRIEETGAALLYVVDVCAIPANVSLALALVFVSEFLGIPVIHYSRRFYWDAAEADFYLNRHLGEFFSPIDVLYPWESRSWMHLVAGARQSRQLIALKGINPANIGELPPDAGVAAIANALDEILRRLYLQLQPNHPNALKNTIEAYRRRCNVSSADLQAILPDKNRRYLPGYGRIGFMLFLKSLIDPSYFRVEEQRTRGMILDFARALLEARSPVAPETAHRFYNAVDNLFLFCDGEEHIRHDHSLAYRHRNTLHYPYRDFTHQELMGLVNMLFDRMVGGEETPASVAEFALGDEPLAIDDRAWLDARLRENTPIAYFPGELNPAMFDLICLQPLRRRLKLPDSRPLTAERLAQLSEAPARIYVFCPQKPCQSRLTAAQLRRYLSSEAQAELRLLFAAGVCRIVETEQLAPGIHFSQLGAEALRTLRVAQEQKGILISADPDASMTSDIAALDRFHIGRAERLLTAKILGISPGSRYVQFVPAGIRATLAYPTPVQTAKDLSNALRSARYKRLRRLRGEAVVLHHLKTEAELRGAPVRQALADLETAGEVDGDDLSVSTQSLCGVYKDNQPWSGVVASAQMNGAAKKWQIAILTKAGQTRTVPQFVQTFRQTRGIRPALAWNGGYILNAELVGKLGLPESYIGSPLGLIISEGEALSPPLFNKPAFLVYAGGRLDIQRVNCAGGLRIGDERRQVTFSAAARNLPHPPPDEACFYDLMHPQAVIAGNGRVVLRLAGNVIKEVIHTAANQSVPIIPVGLTLSFPAKQFPSTWNQVDKALRIEMLGWETVTQAIEAGPLLVEDGKEAIAMDVEGWTLQNSIRTQAARMDYTNMRGPKIAIGLDDGGNLSVLAINGRIRESVGATHSDMAQILLELGVKKGMGFDPGGSSTLVVDGRVVNISPYNANYEQDVYALPPQPRAVASAALVY